MNKRNTWIIIISTILFIMLSISIKAGITASIEGWVYSESVENISPILTKIMIGITYIGESYVVIAFCILLIIIPKTRKALALPTSIAVIISCLLNIILKSIFARQRPNILRLINETGYSFPSGHAMINATFYTIIIMFIFKFIKSNPLKISLSIIMILLTVMIGISRIYLGVHYAGDVLGGWLIGFAISVLVYSIWNDKKIIKKLIKPNIKRLNN